jgi:hypothetical protein
MNLMISSCMCSGTSWIRKDGTVPSAVSLKPLHRLQTVGIGTDSGLAHFLLPDMAKYWTRRGTNAWKRLPLMNTGAKCLFSLPKQMQALPELRER